MGQRGPKPAPAAMHLAKGNPSRKPLAQLLDEFKPEVEIPDYPAWLWPEAKKEWKRIAPELEHYGLISKLDRAALVRLCQAWAEYVWHKQMLGRAMKAARLGELKHEAEQDRLEHEAGEAGRSFTRSPWKGGDGFQVPTPNGNLSYSPHWVAAKRAGEELDRCLAVFGMSPSSRGRVSQSDVLPYLPGLEPGGENAGAPTASEEKPTASLLSLVRPA